MKAQRRYSEYLKDIADATEKIDRFVAGVSFDTFAADDEKAYAVMHAMEIVGEATKRIPDSVRQRYPDVPWRAMAGMRDKLAHDYFGINLQRVWQTAIEDIPPVRARLVTVLEDELKREERSRR